MKRLRVLIVGLDGAAWNVIEPLARAGEVPHLARIMAGVRGPLESTLPPVTPPAWTSFMTGKNPGQHGLYDFVEPEPNSYRMRYTNGRSRRARTIWSILSDAGCRVGVVNVPMTFPPEPVNGFMISGRDAPDAGSASMFPAHLDAAIRSEVGPIKLDDPYLGFMHNDARRTQVLRELAEIDEQRLRVMRYLLQREPTDVFMVVYGSPDACQHYFWHYADPSHHRFDPVGARMFGNAIGDVYRRLDRHVAVLMEHLADDGVVMIVSDHGFGPTSSKIIYLNRYLTELGVLTYRNHARGEVARLFSTALRRLDRGLRRSLTSDHKRRLAHAFPQLRMRWETSVAGLDAVDWETTKAYCPEVLGTRANIWINVKGRHPHGTVAPGAEYRELVDFLTERVMALKDPDTGSPLVHRVVRKEEAYAGPHLDQAPDLLLAWWEGDGFVAKTSDPGERGKPVIARDTGTVSGRAEWTGIHRLDGVVAMRGASLKTGAHLTGARIVDLAPTILHLLGQPVPDEMEGRVLADAFTEESLARRPVSYRTVAPMAGPVETDTYSAEEADMIRQRLQDLGYLG